MDTNGLGGLVAFTLGWFLAQSGKLIGNLIKNKGKMSFREVAESFMRSGGMPSGHTACFTGLTIYLGMTYGWLSGIFVLSLAMTVIVVYDAVNVRYAVGEQGKLLNIIAENDNSKKTKSMKVVEGHTIPQAIVGAIMGIIIGVLCGFWF